MYFLKTNQAIVSKRDYSFFDVIREDVLFKVLSVTILLNGALNGLVVAA